MDVKRRLEEVMRISLLFEKDFDIEKLVVNNINIWPVLKHVAFFDFKEEKITTVNGNKRKLLHKVIRKIKNKLLNFVYTFKLKKISNLQETDLLFCGANSYYVNWNNHYENKFFDPIIENLKSSYSCVQINYSQFNLPNLLNDASTYNIHQFEMDGAKKNDHVKMSLALEKLLKSDVRLQKLLTDYAEIVDSSVANIIAKIDRKVKNIFLWKYKWTKIIEQIKPKMGIVLCYYDESMYGLILALKEKKIPSIDVQHGGQGAGHPAYSFNSEIKVNFDLLPDCFWVWDEIAAENINRWALKNSITAIVGGNPWIRKFKEMDLIEPLFKDKKLILCTLPADKSYYNLMPDCLLKAMKDAGDDFIFGFRFHPKTTEIGKVNFKKLIAQNNLETKVDIVNSNNYPLPYLFANTWCHLSVGSIGSIAEAAIVGVERNVILDSIGRQYYEKLIIDGKAEYFDANVNRDLFSFIQTLNTSSVNQLKTLTGYKEILTQIWLNESK